MLKENVFKVTEYGADSTGKHLSTAAFQKAVDDCHLQGGRVYVPKGSYILGSIQLKSNVELFLDEGAMLLGSKNFNDFGPEETHEYPYYQDLSHSTFHLSMFWAENSENITIQGKGVIDMRSVWDTENIRKIIVNRGAKAIALRECKNLTFKDFSILNATDLALYLAGCEKAEIVGLKMRTYIDGISPDCCKDIKIDDCDVETGDDGIVFKSSYTLNRLESCENITVGNCKIKSRCNAIKFGTETNGDFKNIHVRDCFIRETRLAGIAVESVDGANIDGLSFCNIQMQNVGTPIFVHLGQRLRGPQGTKVGSIKNVSFENITAKGPYVPYETIAWNYISYVNQDEVQAPWHIGQAEGFNDANEEFTAESAWQISSSVCGLKGKPLQNVSFKNVHLEVDGGVKTYERKVPEKPLISYPEVYCYGRILPANGIYFRYLEGLTMENVTVKTLRLDARESFIWD